MTNRKVTARLQKFQRPPRQRASPAPRASNPPFHTSVDGEVNFNMTRMGRTGSGRSFSLSGLCVQFGTAGGTHLGKENLQ